jgi:hypothetical protein
MTTILGIHFLLGIGALSKRCGGVYDTWAPGGGTFN